MNVEAMATWLLGFAINGWAVGVPVGIALWGALRIAPRLAPRVRLAMIVAVTAVIFVLSVPPTVAPRAAGQPAAPDPVATGAAGISPVVPVSLESHGALAGAVVWLWLFVSATLVVREVVSAIRLTRLYGTWMEIASPVGSRSGVRFMTGPSGTPMTLGLWRMVVYLPRRVLDDLDPETVARVARHELDHAQWRDPLVGAIARFIRNLAWPVGAFWWLERQLAAEAEAAADRAAIRQTDGPTADDRARTDYATSLLEVARWRLEDQPSLLAVQLGGGKLEERVRRILDRSPGSVAALALAALMLTTGTIFAASMPAAGRVSHDAAPVSSNGTGRTNWVDHVLNRLAGRDPDRAIRVVLRQRQISKSVQVVVKPHDSSP